MLDFIKAFFRPVPPSGTTAKERLRLVLLSDHLSLAPDVVDALKRDLLEVISRYVEIDPANADVTFEQRETEVAMLASIPITGVRDRERPRAPSPAIKAPLAPPAALAVTVPQAGADAAEESVTLADLLAQSESASDHHEMTAPITLVVDSADELDVSAVAAVESSEEPHAAGEPGTVAVAGRSMPRRRRRKKKQNSSGVIASGNLATGSA